MSFPSDKPPKWRRIAISTNGKAIAVRHNNLTPQDLTDLFYAALKEIPHAPIAMELALQKYNNKKT